MINPQPNKQLPLPLIVSDMDGVLRIINHLIPNVPETLDKYLTKPLEELNPDKYSGIKVPFPFMILTNRGGCLQQHEVQQYNKLLKNYNDKCLFQLDSQQIVVNYSPLHQVLETSKQKMILLAGHGKLDLIVNSFGLHKYITVEQYIQLYPYLCGLSSQIQRTQETQRKTIETLNERFGYQNKQSNNDQPMRIDEIFIMSDVDCWEDNLQIIIDLLSTPDGQIPCQKQEYEEMKQIKLQTHIPLYILGDDLQYNSGFQIPRLAGGPFNIALKAIYKKMHGRELDIVFCCQPHAISYQYCQSLAEKRSKHPIARCYMIGDNPGSDIRGANNIGWTSILVRTGVFQGKENDETYPAKYVVKDFTQAMDLIFKLQQLAFSSVQK